MRYADLTRELEKLTIPFAEGAWRDAEDMQADYGVWAMESDARLIGDDGTAERQWRVAVHLLIWGGKGFREAQAVEDAMDDAGVSWQLVTSGLLEDSGFTHWHWIAYCIPED